MKSNLITLLCGIIFGVGLSLSQMINPNKVLNFMDITGSFDPSLILVMMGALLVAILAFKSVLKRQAPLLAPRFQLSEKLAIDKPLILGSAIFGIGWGMSGYCPGPAVAGLGLLSYEAALTVVAIYLGFFVYHRLFDKR